ncbi:MAG: hypothetical protein ABEI78_02135 [Candidatus Nanohaloarchaea archaeon]
MKDDTIIYDIVVISLVVFSIIFSIEFPVLQSISPYASINTEDISISLLLIYFIYKKMKIKSDLEIICPEVTVLIGITSSWILISTIISSIRSGQLIIISLLWNLKWLLGVIFFIVLQDIIQEKSAKIAIELIIYSGVILSIYSIIESSLGGFRIGVFFDNPNTFSSFLILVSTLSITKYKRSPFYLFGGFISAIAILTTGSRSGVLGLLIGYFILSILLFHHTSKKGIIKIIPLILVSPIFVVSIVDKTMIKRITGWVKITSEGVKLTNTVWSRSFRTR